MTFGKDPTSITFLVLDEADRLLEQKSFEPDLRRIAHRKFAKFPIHPKRQTILTSATWSAEIERIARQYMCDAKKVQVGRLDLTPAKNVSIQITKISSESDRRKELICFINKLMPRRQNYDSDDSEQENEAEEEAPENFKVIIFTNRKDSVDQLYSQVTEKSAALARMTWRVHGDYDQVSLHSKPLRVAVFCHSSKL